MPITDMGVAYEEEILNKIGLLYSGLHWGELGNQHYKSGVAKTRYVSLGVIHTALDINGRDGSLLIDLDRAVPKRLENKFDVITNYGTTEHVNNQYSVFRNIHNMCKVTGIMIHIVPAIGHWRGHCRYYYSKKFFEGLLKECKYKLIDLRMFTTGMYRKKKHLVVCTLKKCVTNSFIQAKKFRILDGIYDSKCTKKTGNYNNVGTKNSK